MSRNLKIQLLFKDRIGIVFDIASLMTRQQRNILAMEVEQKDGFATISMEMEKESPLATENPLQSKRELLDMFSSLEGLQSCRELRALPQEKRERWFKTLFDGMSEGIISVNSAGIVNTVNSVACRLLGDSYENIIGRHINEVSPGDSILGASLNRRIPVSRKKTVVTDTGRVEFYGAAKPINDSSGNCVGAVLLMKNLKEAQEMFDVVAASQTVTFDDFIGCSPAINSLISFAKKIAETSSIVSLSGESGTGKELFAGAIHFESGRKGPFIPINCAALPEQLIESELFGYVDGAFTGARRKGKPGLFEAADSGTVFLDEIGDMPLGTQAKILRILQDGRVRRLGGFDERRVDVRVITATNKDLRLMVEQQRFREDLYYRVNVLNIQIPPLREREMDISLLADSFLQQVNRKLGKSEQRISAAGLAKLRSHSWPGNVRELKNVIERAAVLCDGVDIPGEAIHFSNDNGVLVEYSAAGAIDPGKGLKGLLGEYEATILLDALNQYPSIRRTAAVLGISHSALLRKMEKHGLVRNSAGAKADRWSFLRPS